MEPQADGRNSNLLPHTLRRRGGANHSHGQLVSEDYYRQCMCHDTLYTAFDIHK